MSYNKPVLPNNLASSLTANDYAIVIGGDDEQEALARGSRVTFERGSQIIATIRASSIHEELEATLKGLTDHEVLRAREQWGKNEIPEKVVPLWKMILKQLQGPMPYMIEAATLLSAVLKQWPPFGILIAILIINTMIGFHEEKKAKDALDGLKNSMVSTVPCKRNGQVVVVDVVDLVPNDIIFLRGGNVVPADCTWLEGDTFQVDTAALTGEAIPRKIPSSQYGNTMLSGCVVKVGEGFCRVDTIGVHTEIGMGMAAIQENSGVQMGFFEKKIMAVVAGIIAITIVDIIVLTILECFYRDRPLYSSSPNAMLLWDLAIMVAAVPIALPLVIQVTMAIGASTMAEKKAIITHLTALQEIASMKVLCSDKTGTLTTANMTIISDKIWCNEGFSRDQVLTWAAIASNPNNKEDPVDQAVFRGFETHFGKDASAELIDQYPVTQFMGFNPVVKRTVVRCSHMGQPLVITKGLLNKVLDTYHGLDQSQIAAGDNDGGELQWRVEQLSEIGSTVRDADMQLALAGYKTIAVAVRSPPSADQPGEGPMVLAGIVPMLDPPRLDTALTIHRIRDAQIDVKMITGDHLNIAKETSKLINLGTNILPATSLWPASAQRDQSILLADGFAQVLPKDKKEVVMVLQNMNMVTGMTGDGVNDAPALSQAQIGIAVDGATEAAKAAADIILTTPGLSAIFEAIVESRKIFQRLLSYILYRMAATIQIVLVLTLLIVVYDHMIDPLYVILLALFNDVTMAPISSDKALPSKKPDVPTIKYMIGMSLVFGLLSTLQTMIYYHRPNLWDVPNEYDTGQHVDYDKVKHDTQIEFNSHRHANVWDVRSSATYVQISIAVELLIFSCRTTGWFFMDMPSLGLVSGVMIANVIVSVCAVYGVIVTPRLDWNWVGNIWIYNIGCLFIIDCVKIFVNKMIGNSHDDILGYSDIPDENNENVRGTYGGVSENGPRSSVRRSSVLNRPSRQIQNRYSRLSNVDYGGAARASVASRSSNLRRNVPGNVAQDFDNIARASMAGGETSFWQGW